MSLNIRFILIQWRTNNILNVSLLVSAHLFAVSRIRVMKGKWVIFYGLQLFSPSLENINYIERMSRIVTSVLVDCSLCKTFFFARDQE